MSDIAKELRRTASNVGKDWRTGDAFFLDPHPGIIAKIEAAADALDAKDERIAALEAALAGGWQPTHRHVKRGTEYEHIGTARLQTDEPLGDMAYVEVYLGRDGDLWVRNHSEFYDGRFEPLPAPPSRINKEDRNG